VKQTTPVNLLTAELFLSSPSPGCWKKCRDASKCTSKDSRLCTVYIRKIKKKKNVTDWDILGEIVCYVWIALAWDI
jgi:hypothetical protein